MSSKPALLDLWDVLATCKGYISRSGRVRKPYAPCIPLRGTKPPNAEVAPAGKEIRAQKPT